ncbi:hypothetical protein [Amycolatopsis sp. CA-230715]|uniref:hypothetical protein n=1 Tax=Amycolatopsis sp. CA-230715 TaxID=2745196 RepID=UPI001C02866F|nr:hypothetical protein [Amycolatopsis sp. CA-230715]QWF77754.1 hypothetical protein HUW46_01146 [Amycolatopsis sp. CA-230715]
MHGENGFVQALLGEAVEDPLVWTSGDFPELRAPARYRTPSTPEALVSKAAQAVRMREALTPETAHEGVRPVYAVLDIRSLATVAAGVTRWELFETVVTRGPAVDVHLVLARPGALEDCVSGERLAILVRIVKDLQRNVDLAGGATDKASPTDVAAVWPPSAAGLLAPLPDVAPKPLATVLREVVSAAEGRWPEKALARAQALVDPRSRVTAS